MDVHLLHMATPPQGLQTARAIIATRIADSRRGRTRLLSRIRNRGSRWSAPLQRSRLDQHRYRGSRA